jgi:hypothetical protein
VPTGTPGAEAFVQIWERGRREHPLDRALTILSVLSGHPRQELAALSVERRDQLLLAWRSHLFGPTMAAVATCPRCECAVDVSLATEGPEAFGEDRFAVAVAGLSMMVRMPTSLDLAAAAATTDVESARRLLVRRCLEGVTGPAGLYEPDGPDEPAGLHEQDELYELDELARRDEVIAAVESELDRRAGVSAGAVRLTCPDCAEQWALELDVGAFMYREIEILSTRLLRSVDVLARRYGWSEAEILALSADRRSFYLELAS